jgi:GNAT superfamily N-acetyltransferase
VLGVVSVTPVDPRRLIGARVVVRRRAGFVDGRQLYADVVGVLLAVGPTLQVRGRDGRLAEVPIDEVHRIKPVDLPSRLRISPLELQAIAAEGWPATETAWLGRWLLRAAEGWSGRANSAAPLGDPGRPLADAIEAVRSWYAERGLPPMVQVPIPGAEAVDDALAAAGFRAGPPVLVQVAPGPVAAARARATAGPAVQLTPTPSAAWLAHYRPSPTAIRVLAGARQPIFAAVEVDGEIAGIARGAIDRGWLGISAVQVREEHRRRGLAGALVSAVIDWGRENGAHSAYLQVAADNYPAIALYEKIGFVTHHTYHYRSFEE